MRTLRGFAFTLALLLAACGPAAGTVPPLPSQAAATKTPTAVWLTAVAESAVVTLTTPVTAVTVVVGTMVPGQPTLTTAPISTPLPATPIPTLPTGLGPTTLKYRLLDLYPDLFYCDPDYYPVARANEMDLALQRFPQLQANPEEFQAILSHLSLSGATSFTDEQKLQIYRQHKRLAAVYFTLAAPASRTSGNGYQFQFQIKDSSGQGFIINGFIDGAGTVTVQARQPSIATCPICLAAHTLIATPRGQVAVEDLRAGDVVWTLDGQGKSRAVPILKTARVPAAPGQPVVHLALGDGRQLWASPGHPTADGRFVGQLRPGDWLDGGQVTLAELALYNGPATYDILPAGETGAYWAGGILVGSTLK
jgi:hypothetical protein